MAKTAAKKTPAPAALEPIDIRRAMGVSEDELDAAQAARAIGDFLKSIAGFFTTALALEQTAKQLLDTAKMLTAPDTAEEDAELQRFIKRTSAAKRDVEAHWTITATVSAFHKRLTSRRAVATGAADEANMIGNRLHNAYVDRERRRVAEAQERIRREAEAEAQRRRDLELKAAEEAALKAEADSPTLSSREDEFIELLMGRCRNNPIAAARSAGYKDPVASAPALLAKPKIQQALQARTQAAAIREQAAAKRDEPLRYETPNVEANIIKAPGAFDRTTWAGERLDDMATLEAWKAGKHGIPADLFQVNPVKLNEYARSLGPRLDLWPGVRAKKTTKVI